MASEVREPPKNFVTNFPISGGSTQDQFSLPPVGAILQENWLNWENLGVSPWVVSILRHGYKLSLQSNPPLQSVPAFFKPPESLAKRKLLQEEIKALQNKKAIELIQPGKPAFWSRMFLVPKTGNQWRSIIDLSILNQYLRAPNFHMETPESIRLAIQPNDWAISIDLADAYLHIPIHRDHRKYHCLCISKSGMAIQGASFRIVPSTLDFYKCGGGGEENSPKARSHCSPIPRRLVSEIQIQKVTCDSSTVANASVQSPRFASKPEQIGAHPDKGFRVCRVQVQNRNSQSISDRKAYCRYPSQRCSVLANKSQSSPRLDVNIGPLNVNRENGSSGTFTFEGASILSKKSMESSTRECPETGTIDSYSIGLPQVVDGRDKPQKRFSNTSTQTPLPCIYGCINPGLGSSHGYGDCIREMVPRAETIAHKQSGTNSCPSSIITLGKDSFRQCGAGSHGQFNGCCLHKQAGGGGDNIQIPLPRSTKTVAMGTQKEHHNPGQAHSRQTECSGRHIVQGRSNNNHRMVSLSSNISQTVPVIHKTMARSVCHQMELQDKQLCFPNSRSPSMGSRCTINVLDRDMGIRISPNSNSGLSSEQNHIRRLPDNADSSSIQQCTLVPDITKSASRGTSGITTIKKHAKTTPVEHISLLPRIPQASRLDLVRRSVEAKGFSAEASRCITEPVRSSTNAIYESKWKLFTNWCVTNLG